MKNTKEEWEQDILITINRWCACKGFLQANALLSKNCRKKPVWIHGLFSCKEINDLKNDVADIRKMIEDTKKMFMGGFPKPPMPPMPNVPAPMK